MEEPIQGHQHLVQVTHTFTGIFSHYEEEYGVKYACFEQMGVGKSGKTYRKIRVDDMKLLK